MQCIQAIQMTVLTYLETQSKRSLECDRYLYVLLIALLQSFSPSIWSLFQARQADLNGHTAEILHISEVGKQSFRN